MKIELKATANGAYAVIKNGNSISTQINPFDVYAIKSLHLSVEINTPQDCQDLIDLLRRHQRCFTYNKPNPHENNNF